MGTLYRRTAYPITLSLQPRGIDEAADYFEAINQWQVRNGTYMYKQSKFVCVAKCTN